MNNAKFQNSFIFLWCN